MKTVLDLWGSTFNNLNFDYNVNQLCKKASKKRHALARIAEYIDINKRGMFMKAFMSSQFSNCPLIMICSRKMEHRINNIHKRNLKFVFDDSCDFTFQELLAKGRSDNVHQKHPQLPAAKIVKSKTGVSPELMNNILHSVGKETTILCA